MSSVLADDSGLITQQITVNVPEAGTLKNKISSERKFKITNLKLTGELNIEDFQIIREMAGCYKEDGSKYNGHLQYLDLKDVKLTSGGSAVYAYREKGSHNHYCYECPTSFRVSVSSGRIDGVFIYLYDLKSLILPDDVYYIGEKTFQHCRKISSLTLPASLESVGKDAFGGMGSSTTIPTSLYVRSKTPPSLANFRRLSGYVNGEEIWQEFSPFDTSARSSFTLYLPFGTYELYKNSESWKDDFGRFKDVIEYDPILLPISELITNQVIYNVEEPGTLSSLINDYNKCRITNLKLSGELDINDVKFIREMAGCYEDVGVKRYDGHLKHLDLSEVTFKYPTEFGKYDELDIFSKNKNTSVRSATLSYERRNGSLFAYLDNLRSVVLPNDFSDKYWGFLEGCSGLTSVKIPSEVVSIGSSTFEECSSLTSVELPSGLIRIGSSTFSNCTSLTSIELPSGLTSIGSYAFEYCGGLTSVELPSGLTSIGACAFKGCRGLTSVNLPSGLTSIGNGVFEDCSGLTSVKIPLEVTSIGLWTFSGCRGLTSVNLPSGLTSIGNGVFEDCCGLTSMKIPSGVTSIGESAFANCSGLTSLEIPSGVTSIEEGTFSGCSNLKSVKIPSGVTSIGAKAFANCSGLCSLEIPSGVTSIGAKAFANCSFLTSLEIPSGLTSIEEGTFGGCLHLKSVEIPSGVTSIGAEAFANCSSLTSLKIPSGVTSIGAKAFANCSFLSALEIPSGVTSIEKGTFWGCYNLTSLSLPVGLTSIGQQAFDDCYSLTSLEIPSGVTSIGAYAFRKCYRLTSLSIPSGVTSFGEAALSDCSGLASVYAYMTTPATASTETFNGIDKDKCTLYVPQGSYIDYYLAPGWDYFNKIVEFDPTGIDSVTTNSDVKEVSRYSVDGQKLDAPVKGLNIVKYSDGSIKKVVVK